MGTVNSIKTINLNIAGYKKNPATGLVESIDVYDGNGDIYTITDDVNAQNTKTIKFDYNGSVTVTPDAPYTSIENVVIDVNVPLGKKLYAWKHNTDIIYTKTLPTKDCTIEVVVLPLANAEGEYTAATPEKTVSIWKDGANFIDATGAASTEPSGTAGSPVDVGDYVTDGTSYFTKSDDPEEIIHNIWKIGTTFYNYDMTVGTEPAGTAGSSTAVGSVYQAQSTDTHLVEDAWYCVEGAAGSEKYYPVVSLSTADINHGEEITDADALAELAAASFSTIVTVPYTEEVYEYHKVLNFGTTEAATVTKDEREMDAAVIAVLQADTPSEIDYVPYTIAAVDEALVYSTDSYERDADDDYEV